MPDTALIGKREHEKLVAEIKGLIVNAEETYFAVGERLQMVLEQQSYILDDFESFEAWCGSVLNLGRAHANRLIAASKVRRELDGKVTRPPENEWQARALGKVPPGKRAEVWQAAVTQAGDKPVTQSLIEAAAQRATPAPVVEPEPSPIGDEPPAQAADDDGLGAEMDRVCGLFDAVIREVRGVKKAALALADSPEGVFIRRQSIEVAVANLVQALASSRPGGRCPYCAGGDGGPGGCKACKGMRWLNQLGYDQAPSEMKGGE